MKLVPIGETELGGMCVDSLPGDAAAVLPMVRSMYGKDGFTPPWICYLAVEQGTVVGTCGFKSAPMKGTVELAYYTFPSHERKGVATRMVRELVNIAQRVDACIRVIAQTLPQESASTSVLKKVGFVYMQEVQHPEDGRVWEWELSDAVT